MTLPKTYKQATFKEKGGSLVLEDVEFREPSAGEVLIKVEACGVCHSDSFAQDNVWGVGFPITPGHEMIGRVVAVGEGVKDWKVGDRAGGPWHGGHDGTCHACRQGLYNMCDNEIVNGVTRHGGSTVRIPEHVDAAKYAPILCAGVTVFNGIRQQHLKPGSTVAVQGLGGLGHLALQYSSKSGYRTVALSRDGRKEKFARDLGAHEYIDGSKGDTAEQLLKLGGADMIVCTAPDANLIGPLLKGLAPQGKILILAAAGPITFDSIAMISRGLSVVAWPSGHARDSEEAILFTDLTGVECMVEPFPLEKANEAYNHMMEGKARFRAVLVPGLS